MYEELIERLREYPDREETAGGYVEIDWQDLLDAADALESLTDQLAALQSENAEKQRIIERQQTEFNASADEFHRLSEKYWAERDAHMTVVAEKDKEIERLRLQRPAQVDGDVMALTLELAETKAALSRVEAERDAAIQDSVVRCCGTCNACTKGTYNGRCMVCALCECVPERLREYHKNHYSKSLWKWRGAQGEG